MGFYEVRMISYVRFGPPTAQESAREHREPAQVLSLALPVSTVAAMKTLGPAALGATCLGLQLINNPVEGFIATPAAGEEVADSPATRRELQQPRGGVFWPCFSHP